MAGAFPTITSGAVACYGSSRTVTYKTNVITCQDLSDYRSAARGKLSNFQLVFTAIKGYDLSKIRAFWISQKGGFDSTWSLTFQGNTYNNCAFADDNWNFVENPDSPNRYSGTLNIEQKSQ